MNRSDGTHGRRSTNGPRSLKSLVIGWRPQRSVGRETLDPDDASSAFAAQWERAVGPDVARRSRPTRFRNGVLTVLTAISAWSEELGLHAPRILEALRSAVPGARLARLRFTVASGRTLLLLDAERSQTKPRVDARTAGAPAPPAQPTAEDVGALVARLAAQQPALDAQRDRSGWHRCARCGRRFWPGPADASLCAVCVHSRRAAAAAAIERALMQAPWLSLDELRRSAPRTASGAYERTKQRLLARWRSEIESAQRRLRRGTLGADDRVVAWSYLMLASGLSQRDIGQAVVTDVLGREWTSALFGAGAAPKREAGRSVREKHKR